MARERIEYAPTLLEAEPAYLAAFCARAEALDIELPRPHVVTLSYTCPSRPERMRIARVLGASIASTYGSTETGAVLVECERGRMHHNATSCRIDLEPMRGATGVGRLLITPFGHPCACYLEFDVGDLARLAAAPCPCGRQLTAALRALYGTTWLSPRTHCACPSVSASRAGPQPGSPLRRQPAGLARWMQLRSLFTRRSRWTPALPDPTCLAPPRGSPISTRCEPRWSRW
ncbi:MAG TPA: hypothetical protein VF469_16025 [Kofleriaceae bacterium]